MAPPRDLREWIALLEREGELRRISVEADPDLEITEITDRVVKSGGPALLFEKPKGSEHPLLINQFGTEKRMCMAFGVDSLDDAAAKLGDILDMQPPEGLREKVRGLLKLKSVADSRPKTVSKAPCQEVVLRATTSTSARLPDPALLAGRPGAVHHAPRRDHAGPEDRRSQRRHVPDAGDRPLVDLHALADAQGRPRRLLAAEDGRIPVAVAIGLDPVTAYSASAPLPKHLDELMLAGFLRGEPVELVMQDGGPRGACERGDRPRGHVSKDDVGIEGPFGDHTGYYSHAEPFPIFRISAMTMRRDAIYPSIVVGKPPAEDAWLGKATERIFLPAVRMTLPEIVDYDLPVAGAFHNCVIVSIRKAFPGHAQKVMHALWGLGMLSLSKSIVVVDAHVNVHDYADVFFRVTANVDPKRDILITEGPLDHLDHAPTVAVLRRQGGHRRDPQAPRGGRTAVAGGDRHELTRSGTS